MGLDAAHAKETVDHDVKLTLDSWCTRRKQLGSTKKLPSWGMGSKTACTCLDCQDWSSRTSNSQNVENLIEITVKYSAQPPTSPTFICTPFPSFWGMACALQCFTSRVGCLTGREAVPLPKLLSKEKNAKSYVLVMLEQETHCTAVNLPVLLQKYVTFFCGNCARNFWFAMITMHAAATNCYCNQRFVMHYDVTLRSLY